MRFPQVAPNRHHLILAVASLATSALVWAPFFLRLPSFWGIPLPQQGMATIVANYDGPYYIVAAKSLYRPQIIDTQFEFPLPAKYYSAHWPAYPLLTRTLAPLLGYPYALLAITQLSSILAVIFFYKLLIRLNLKKLALPLSLLSLIFPARYLVVHSTGSPEPLFIFALLASLYYFIDGKYLLAGLFGTLTQLTKSPGILLFFAYTITLLYPSFPYLATGNLKSALRKINLKALLPQLLIPLAALGVFLYYNYTYHDFFAYFHSGDNIHLLFPPFQVFNSSFPWVGTFWLEEIIYLYLIEAAAILCLFKKPQLRPLALFGAIFYLSTLFISHRDLSRYSLPLAPIVLVAFAPLLAKKEFQIALAIILIPIYLFAINFISQNALPISNWSPLL